GSERGVRRGPLLLSTEDKTYACIAHDAGGGRDGGAAGGRSAEIPGPRVEAIGAKAAQRILEYRQKNGSFKKPEDLMNVKGIGEKAFLKLKPYLTVTDRPEKSGI